MEIAENNKVTVKGPKGTLERVLPSLNKRLSFKKKKEIKVMENKATKISLMVLAKEPNIAVAAGHPEKL